MVRDDAQAVGALEEFDRGHVTVEVASQRHEADIRRREEYVAILRFHDANNGWAVRLPVMVANEGMGGGAASDHVAIRWRGNLIVAGRRNEAENHAFPPLDGRVVQRANHD